MTVTVDTKGEAIVVGSSSKTVVNVSVEIAVLVKYEVTVQSSPRTPPAEELVEIVEEVFANRPERCD